MIPDFIGKYGPLLHILQGGDEDINTLAGSPGYTRVIGRQWRKTHCQAVRGYMHAIRIDYEVLWQQISGKAVYDPMLAAQLAKTENQLRRLERRMRLYLLIQRIAPTPMPGQIGLARSLFMNLFPAVDTSKIVQLLSAMHTLHDNAGAKVFLP